MAQAAPIAMPVPMPVARLWMKVPSVTPSAKAIANPLAVSPMGVGLGEGVLSSSIAFGVGVELLTVCLVFVHRMRVATPNDPSSATRPTERHDCNSDAMAGFAAAYG